MSQVDLKNKLLNEIFEQEPDSKLLNEKKIETWKKIDKMSV